MTLGTDYTYEHREGTGQYSYRRFYIDYPQVYADGDTLEEANAAFKAMLQRLALDAIERRLVILTISVEKGTFDD